MLSSLPVRQAILRRVILSPAEFVTKLQNLHSKVFGPNLESLALQIISSKDLSVQELIPNLRILWSSLSSDRPPIPEILKLPPTSTGRTDLNSVLPFGLFLVIHQIFVSMSHLILSYILISFRIVIHIELF